MLFEIMKHHTSSKLDPPIRRDDMAVNWSESVQARMGKTLAATDHSRLNKTMRTTRQSRPLSSKDGYGGSPGPSTARSRQRRAAISLASEESPTSLEASPGPIAPKEIPETTGDLMIEASAKPRKPVRQLPPRSLGNAGFRSHRYFAKSTAMLPFTTPKYIAENFRIGCRAGRRFHVCSNIRQGIPFGGQWTTIFRLAGRSWGGIVWALMSPASRLERQTS